MHQSFSQRQSPSNKKYPSSARNYSKLGSQRQFNENMSQFQDRKSIDKQGQIFEILHSENQFKIRSFKEQFSMLNDRETMQFEDGSIYEGQLTDEGIRHGIGIFQSVDGDIYLGDWQQDRYHGYGLYVYHDGQRYEGQLFQGLKQGQGKYFYKDGRIYEGEWTNDQRQGQGIQKDEIKGIFYHGQWANDQKNGHGKICLLNHSISYSQPSIVLLQGVWSHDIFTEGVIKSQVYQGQFRNQAITGKGVYKFPDGSVYNGQFYNNLFHGHGVYYYPNGDIYEGEFISGLKSGTGVYKYFTGEVYNGEYEKDLKSGEGKFIFINGHFYVGQFQKDSFHGNGRYFFNQTQSITGSWYYGKFMQSNTMQPAQIIASNLISPKNLQGSTINKTPIKNFRSTSPLKLSSSIHQSSARKNLNPFAHEKVHSNIFQKQEKAGMIHINPKNSYIPSSTQNFSQTPKSQQNIYQNSNSFMKSNQNNFNQNDEFNKLISKKNEKNEVFSESKTYQKGNPKQYYTERKIDQKNLYNIMNQGIQEDHDDIIPPLQINQKKTKKLQQGPKKSKRKLQYR